MDKLRSILQEKFEGYEPRPSRDIWPHIAANMQEKEQQAPVRKLRLWPLMAAALMALLLGGFWLWQSPSEKADIPQMVQTEPEGIEHVIEDPKKETNATTHPTPDIVGHSTQPSQAPSHKVPSPKRAVYKAATQAPVPSLAEGPKHAPITKNSTNKARQEVQPTSVEKRIPQISTITPQDLPFSLVAHDASWGQVRGRTLKVPELTAPPQKSLWGFIAKTIHLKSPVKKSHLQDKQERNLRLKVGPIAFEHIRHRDGF